jgi:DNA-binding NtrC family response regulator
MPRILLVEDDVAIRSVMERAFEREGMSVQEGRGLYTPARGGPCKRKPRSF